MFIMICHFVFHSVKTKLDNGEKAMNWYYPNTSLILVLPPTIHSCCSW